MLELVQDPVDAGVDGEQPIAPEGHNSTGLQYPVHLAIERVEVEPVRGLGHGDE